MNIRQMEFVKLMYLMKKNGESFKAIGDELEKRKIKTKLGRTTWSSLDIFNGDLYKEESNAQEKG